MVYYPTNNQAEMLARIAKVGKANHKSAGQLNSAGEIIGKTSMGQLCATACEYSYLHYDKNSVGRAGAQMGIHCDLLWLGRICKASSWYARRLASRSKKQIQARLGSHA